MPPPPALEPRSRGSAPDPAPQSPEGLDSPGPALTTAGRAELTRVPVSGRSGPGVASVLPGTGRPPGLC
ncbi:hypothetical protein C1N81_35610 [Streptomyces sp. SGAir0957]